MGATLWVQFLDPVLKFYAAACVANIAELPLDRCSFHCHVHPTLQYDFLMCLCMLSVTCWFLLYLLQYLLSILRGFLLPGGNFIWKCRCHVFSCNVHRRGRGWSRCGRSGCIFVGKNGRPFVRVILNNPWVRGCLRCNPFCLRLCFQRWVKHRCGALLFCTWTCVLCRLYHAFTPM